jgi:hypothetical protein
MSLERKEAYQHSKKRLFSDPNPPARLLRARSSSSSSSADERALASIEGSSHFGVVPRRSANEMSFLNLPGQDRRQTRVAHLLFQERVHRPSL